MKEHLSLNFSNYVDASTITRLLVVSYFIALALNVVSGADINLLATPFLQEDVANLFMRSVVLLLSGMILFGVFRRPAALLLSLVVFWPSYMMLFAGGDVSAFWRDLALVGGLIMSARNSTETETAFADDHGSEDHTLEAQASVPISNAPAAPIDGGEYREDLNLARSV